MSVSPWWNHWFDEQSALCGVIRADDSQEVVRAALGITPATTALVAKIILIHERESIVANGGRDWTRLLSR